MQRSVVFEVSWEVCNKMGGIHTALAGKAQEMVDLYGEHYIAIGPSQWQSAQLGFIERNWHPKLVTSMAEHGIPIRCG
ncbi:MAG: hypothetical protein H6510_06190, partial [Acidobacteria bacterium]|nr:hypothetical protein [Acidobacteriota bacterium]